MHGWICCGLSTLIVHTASWAAADSEMVLTKIAFGSCANQAKPTPIWRTIAEYHPQLLILLGDTVYASSARGSDEKRAPERIAAAYQTLERNPIFAQLRKKTILMATWDDHDYGLNDGGREWVHKEAAAQLFHDFLGTPQNAKARRQEGIYSARVFGPPGRRVQVILLDTRYFRSALRRAKETPPGLRRRPYLLQTGPDTELLGRAQWEWLAEQLRRPAELRLIGSSIQVISDQHPFEKWANFPEERQRLYDLIQKTGANGVVILSGDRHRGEISLDPAAVGYPLYDVTSSGLNQGRQTYRLPEINAKRFAALPYGNHFGTIEVAWDRPSRLVSLQLRFEDGEIAVQARVPLHWLRRRPLQRGT